MASGWSPSSGRQAAARRGSAWSWAIGSPTGIRREWVSSSWRPSGTGVWWHPRSPPVSESTTSPRDRRRTLSSRSCPPSEILVVLDNCEHLVGAVAALVAKLLDGCPSLRVLATSRTALGLSGEQVWRVPPLDLGARGRAVQRSSWAELHAQRRPRSIECSGHRGDLSTPGRPTPGHRAGRRLEPRADADRDPRSAGTRAAPAAQSRPRRQPAAADDGGHARLELPAARARRAVAVRAAVGVRGRVRLRGGSGPGTR